MSKFNNFKLALILITFNLLFIRIINSCTSFYCINHCGASTNGKFKGYKLILANNRDEDVTRPTLPSEFWEIESGKMLNVFGPIDTLNGVPPKYYSTWIGMNEFGGIANLLFYLQPSNPNRSRPRGEIVPNYVLNNSLDYTANDYLNYLEETKFSYDGFNLVLLEQSSQTGDYSLYYLNNNSTKKYGRLNNYVDKSFIFSLSNSDPERQFRKATEGKNVFQSYIDSFSRGAINKNQLIDSLLNKLLLNRTPYYPDYYLAKFLELQLIYEDEHIIANISSINANYLNYWQNARTRTSTLILVDYDNNVEYYEYNLTLSQTNSETWLFNNRTFKLKPIY